MLVPSFTLAQTTSQRGDSAKKLQTLGATMIDKRVRAIDHYDTLLENTKYISDDTINKVHTKLERVKTELTTLKTKIESETDVTTLRADVRSIVDNYRVYQVFLPQSAGLVSVDRMTEYSKKLTEINDKLTAYAKDLQTKGNDMDDVLALLTSAKNSIAPGNGHLTTAQTSFTNMTISDPEGARSLKIEGRAELQDARQNFSQAREDMREAEQKIKEIVK